MRLSFLLTTIYLGIFLSCEIPQTTNNQIVNKLYSLLDQMEVFQARRLFQQTKHKLPQSDSLLFSAKLEYFFNNPIQSNYSISNLLNHYSAQLSDNEKSTLLKLKLHNHVKLFEYSQATDATIELIEKHYLQFDSTEFYELKNELNIWNSLRDKPAQLVTKKEYSKIDLIGSSKIPTFFNHSNSSVNMIFDTGANISVVTESVATSMDIKHLGSSVSVKGILGNHITAEVALASFMNFGNIELENVVLLVFPDSALYFAEADFQIFGIIGYPVISALGEIQRTRNNELIIPSVSSINSYSNLAMDYLTPIVEVVNEQDTLIFSFDTGASETWLYENYYQRNSTIIENRYKKIKINLGGIGSTNKYQVFLIHFPLNVGGSGLELDSVVLFQKNINPDHNKYSGNLGQDVINSFDKMTLNFEQMFIQFSNE